MGFLQRTMDDLTRMDRSRRIAAAVEQLGEFEPEQLPPEFIDYLERAPV